MLSIERVGGVRRGHGAPAGGRLRGRRVPVPAGLPGGDEATADDGADAAENADPERSERPAGAGEVDVQRVVERPAAGADPGEREQGRRQGEVELVALVRHEEPV